MWWLSNTILIMAQEHKDDNEAAWQEHVRAAQELDKQFWKRASEVGSPKFIMKELAKAFIKLPLIVIGLIIGLIMLLLLGQLGDSYLIPFSPKDWKTSHSRQMAERLEHQYQLIGMKRSEVVKLLGEPKETWPGWDMAYSWGSSYDIESECLVFRLKHDKVVAYKIVRSS